MGAARAGFEAVGIDASDAMLELARAKASSETPGTRSRVRFLQMDMTSFDLDQSFRLAIVPFRAFQHLTLPDQQRQALRCVHRSLKAGGHFVIDVFDPQARVLRARCRVAEPGAPA